METTVNETKVQVEDLVSKWNILKEQNPKLRIRNAADELGMKEVQLLATKVGVTAKRLKGDWIALLKELPKLGRVMALTRNDGCVLEHKGEFEKVSGTPHAVTVIGPIETRTFTTNWSVGFAVDEQHPNRRLTSLQFFDKHGDAVMKVYLQPESDREFYEDLVARYLDDNQSQYQSVEPFQAPEYSEQIDKEQFLEEWSALKHTHAFFGMLRKHKVQRLKAIELAENTYTEKISKHNIEVLLNKVSEDKIPIMIFVGNRGNIQIHQDYVHKIVKMNAWINVLDKDFNMHLNLDVVDSAWIVKKPTDDGVITSIEMFDESGEMVVQFFGLRKFGETELDTWREVVNQIK